MKILKKFDLNFILYYYYIYQNTQDKIKISDVDFPSINPNDILVIVAHLKDLQTYEFSIGAYKSNVNYLKDYVANFETSDMSSPTCSEQTKFYLLSLLILMQLISLMKVVLHI